jgi:hypothetical protein
MIGFFGYARKPPLEERTCQPPSSLSAATVTDPSKRAAFDKWYENEHLPDAVKSWGVKKAWRFWSLTDPAVHQATYQFDDEASVERAMKGEDLKRLTADFNRDWPDIRRTRDTFVLAQEFGAD